MYKYQKYVRAKLCEAIEVWKEADDELADDEKNIGPDAEPHSEGEDSGSESTPNPNWQEWSSRRQRGILSCYSVIHVIEEKRRKVSGGDSIVLRDIWSKCGHCIVWHVYFGNPSLLSLDR